MLNTLKILVTRKTKHFCKYFNGFCV